MHLNSVFTVTVTKTHIMGGGVNLYKSEHGLALCHVFNMCCMGIVRVAASYGRCP